jgi:hypothetical protein
MTVTTHPDYGIAAPELKKVRDCTLGSSFVKSERFLYLGHPSQIEQQSTEQQMRYNLYLEGADFPEDTNSTLTALLGKMRIGSAEVELPEQLDYLVNNVDNDGTKLLSSVESSASEAVSVNYNLLVATFKGLESDQIGNVSQTQAKDLNLRAAVKRYSRESIVDWDFKRINGIMQLSYLKLHETDSVINEGGGRTIVNSYLVLSIDDQGYYQQRFTDGEDAVTATERSYVTVNGGKPLKWLPVQFVSTQQLIAGELPKAYGFLHKVAEAALSEYRVSAVYKETQRALTPTMFNAGWEQGGHELFKQLNGGRDYVAMGGMANNNMPLGVETKIVSAAVEMTDFHWFFEFSQKRMQRLGGKPDNAVQMTATEAEINAAEQSALLDSLVSSLEEGWKRVIAYCGMFEGIYDADNIEAALDDIKIELNRDFAKAKLSVEEVRVLRELKMAGDISTKELHRQLSAGGWLMSDIEEMMEEIDDQPPAMDLPDIGEKPQDLTNNTNE